MGGRSYTCSFCRKVFLKRQAVEDHERICVVHQHERIVPLDAPLPLLPRT